MQRRKNLVFAKTRVFYQDKGNPLNAKEFTSVLFTKVFIGMVQTVDSRPYELCFESFVTGHHIYKGIWSSSLNKWKPENPFDRNAVKVLKEDVVGHIPKGFAKNM